MYQIENSSQVLKARGRLVSRLFAPGVSRTVVLLGLTSLFTDISAEMVSTILPLYLLFSLNLSPAVFGVVDGLYQGAAALVRVFGGVAADRSGRHKEVAVLGYALSALARLGLLVVGSGWTLLAGVVMVDRLGKGIRTAPRDAMITLSSRAEDLGTAFGVHRALDTAGAMLGPLMAFGLLTIAPDAYDAVFVVSLCAALIGLGILTLFVQNQPVPAPPEAPRPALTLAAASRLVRVPGMAPLLLVGTALSLATMSDGFLYLTLQRRAAFEPRFFPLLYVATALIFMLLAVPVGRLADRWGRGRVFLAGHALLLAVYGSLLVPWSATLHVAAALVLLGAYYAATDGVLMALAGAVLPRDLVASGLALLTTGTSLARLAGSIGFGALWAWRGVGVAVVTTTIALAAALIMTAVTLRPGKEPRDVQHPVP
ncbi:MAG TPA: MFS transporter [Methylomirabilota bacterium]|nr:MFS transporter [Methylomirabilota bacterium]